MYQILQSLLQTAQEQTSTTSERFSYWTSSCEGHIQAWNCSLRTDALLSTTAEPIGVDTVAPSENFWESHFMLFNTSFSSRRPQGDCAGGIRWKTERKQHGIGFTRRCQIAKRIFSSAGSAVQKEGSHIIAWEQMAIEKELKQNRLPPAALVHLLLSFLILVLSLSFGLGVQIDAFSVFFECLNQ